MQCGKRGSEYSKANHNEYFKECVMSRFGSRRDAIERLGLNRGIGRPEAVSEQASQMALNQFAYVRMTICGG